MRSEQWKRITECVVADIFHWDFSGGGGWDACLLLGDVGILVSVLEEWLHPSAVLLLACLPNPSPFPGHSLWTTSPTLMLYVQSLSSLAVYSCPKIRPIWFWADQLWTPNCFARSQFWCQTLLNGQNKTVGKACSSPLHPWSLWENSFFLLLRLEQKWVYFKSKCRYWGRGSWGTGTEPVLPCGR